MTIFKIQRILEDIFEQRQISKKLVKTSIEYIPLTETASAMFMVRFIRKDKPYALTRYISTTLLDQAAFEDAMVRTILNDMFTELLAYKEV